MFHATLDNSKTWKQIVDALATLLTEAHFLIQKDGTPILLDFGAVIRKNMSRTMQHRTVITSGFSPVEQYDEKGYCGPWTDIYAIGATMRSCIEGFAPPPANKRVENDPMKPAVDMFKRKYSQTLLQAIDWAMEPDQRLRPQSCDELLEMLEKMPPEEDEQPTILNKLLDVLPWKK